MPRLLTAFLCLFVWAGAASATDAPSPEVSSDPFLVQGVEVDVTGDTPVAARAAAFSAARSKAYATLFGRMNPDGKAPEALPDDATISRHVKSLQVQDEHAVKKRYKAKLDVKFRRSVMALTGGRIPTENAANTDNAVAETTETGHDPSDLSTEADAPTTSDDRTESLTIQEPYLVLPWFGTPDHIVLWGANRWREAWERQSAMTAKNGRFLVPVGDVDDMRDYSPIDPRSTVVGLERLKSRYQAKDVVVAMATPNNGQLVVALLVLRNGALQPLGTQTLPLGLGTRMDAAVVSTASHIGGARYAAVAPEDQPEAPDAATDDSARQPTAMPVLVQFSSLPQWVAIKRSIGQVPGVAAFSMRSVSTQDANVVVSFVGDINQAPSAFATRGLMLNRASDGSSWILYQKGAY